MIAVARPRHLLLALGIFATSVSSASAASFEQLSRASGRAGQSDALNLSTAGVASDTGLGGTFTTFTANPTSYFPIVRSYVRNTFTNQTRPAFPDGEVVAVDRAERIALSSSFDQGRPVYRVGPLYGGGTVREITVAPEAGYLSAALTGDGKAVITSAGIGGLQRFDIASGKSTPINAAAVNFGRSLATSDNGRVIAGTIVDETTYTSTAVVVIDGKLTSIPGAESAQISPDGSTLVYQLTTPSTTPGAAASHTLVTRRLATGAERTSPVPASIELPGETPRVIWISPDGRQVALGPGSSFSDTPDRPDAKVLDVATGRWSTFGGPYAGEFGADAKFDISRNGRFATLPFTNQAALVNLSGGGLLGGSDPISAFSYLNTPGFLSTRGAACYFIPARFSDYLAKPADWIPAPRRGSIVVSANGKVIKRATTTAVQPLSYVGTSDPALLTVFPDDTTKSSIKATIVDGQGRTVTETLDQTLNCQPFPTDPGGEQ